MKVLAYSRANPSSPLSEQLAAVENAAHARRHEVLRLTGHTLRPDATEFPPWDAVLGAVEAGLVDAVAVVDLSVLGPDLVRSVRRIARADARLLVGSGRAVHDLGGPELRLVLAVARSLGGGPVVVRPPPKRICPTRVRVDLSEVRALQERKALRLDQIARRLHVSRSTLVRRLRRERERSDSVTGGAAGGSGAR